MNLDGYALPIKKLKGTEPVESLDLSGKNLGVASTIVIASLISVNGSLTSLNVHSNSLGAEGAAALASALAAIGSLTSVDLSENHLTNRGRDMTGIKQLAAALGVNGSLTALDLSYNSFEDEGLSAVCEAIQSNKETKLSSLNFKNNDIGPVGANAVAAMVAATGSLTSLDLSNNALCGMATYGGGTYTAEGITAIANALRVNGSLTELSIYGNRVGDEGVGAICEAIQSNKETKLASLNFGYNGMGPVGANAVAAMVAVTGSLTKMRYVRLKQT